MSSFGTSAIFDPELSDHLLVGNRQAAKLLGLSSPTMQCRRADGSGPPFIRHSAKVIYRIGDLRDWVCAHAHPPQKRGRARYNQGHAA